MDKRATYDLLKQQMDEILHSSPASISVLANAAALLALTFPSFSWTGFYLWQKNKLVLGPFQGKPACSTIRAGEGVCGFCMIAREPVIVKDVHAFPGHIACDSDSQSEIVVPLFFDHDIIGVLDIDSYNLANFDNIDKEELGQVVAIISAHLSPDKII